ncbi:hypothetical protein [Pseudoclavibacter endophyticus]|uniref:Uncharacterized protein n=1 Tax=Pseudoclavibacter endophyticus TaxID=1778590 RepID=A0A6H9WNU9_9MICO|nr:hypothetical protein [Pseudoclavibacter endophyticus]KAB1646925.1 hypothetical protein F8O04_14480 [Pseudoclavibacter endophyticus]
MRKLSRTTAAVIAIVVTSGLALAGCTATEPAPEPSTTTAEGADDAAPTPEATLEIPVKSEPPTSEAEAIELAKLALGAFFVVEEEIFNEHPQDASDLALVAGDAVVPVYVDLAEQLLADGQSRSGSASFEIDESRTIVEDGLEELGDPTRWGYILFYGCLIPSGLTYTLADGSKIVVDQAASHVYAIGYNARSSSWRVEGVSTNPADGVRC